MQKIQDTNYHVTIVNGTQIFYCPTAEFPTYEPSYQALATGQIRLWNTEVRCLLADGNQLPDPFYLAHPDYFDGYLANIATYQAAYAAAHAPTPPTFADAQTAALTNWNTQINRFICSYFDTGTQISFIKLYLQLTDATQKTAIATVDEWVSVVLAYYYDIKAQLQAAATLADIAAIQAAVDLAGRYGPSGSVLAVPAVRLGDFYGDD